MFVFAKYFQSSLIFAIKSFITLTPGVVRSGPEPAVNVDGLEGGGLAPLTRKVALPAGSVDGGNVVCGDIFCEHNETG